MRIVLKLGTSTLTHPTGNLNIRRVEELCKVCSDLKNAGHELVLVSSGAVAMGVGKLSLAERPKDIPGKQAAAAVGQCELMYIYDKLYSQYHHVVAQLLITADDIETPERAKTSTTRLRGCCSCARCRSSTKTTPSPRRSWALATTTRWPPS